MPLRPTRAGSAPNSRLAACGMSSTDVCLDFAIRPTHLLLPLRPLYGQVRLYLLLQCQARGSLQGRTPRAHPPQDSLAGAAPSLAPALHKLHLPRSHPAPLIASQGTRSNPETSGHTPPLRYSLGHSQLQGRMKGGEVSLCHR